MTRSPEFKEAMPITVSFKKNLRTDGELTVARVIQGDHEIQLTVAQMQSLVNEFQARLPKEAE